MTDGHIRREPAVERYAVVLSLGSNLGNSEELLAWAVARARATGAEVKCSGIYATPPWGPIEQPDFRNVTICVCGERTPRQWLLWGNDLEAKALRIRSVKWGPRTLDVDVIAAAWIAPDGSSHAMRSDDPELLIPHPRAAQRAFVLVPWLEVDPAALLAETPVAEILAGLDPAERAGINRLGEVPDVSPTNLPPAADGQ